MLGAALLLAADVLGRVAARPAELGARRGRQLHRRLCVASAILGAGRAQGRAAERSCAVAAQRPDLIIAVNAGLKDADYDKLSQLAPTVAQSGDSIDFGMPWDQQTLLIGRALGREARAKQVVADVSARFQRFRADHPEFDGKTGILALRRPGGLRRLRHRGHPQPHPRRPRLQDPAEADQPAGALGFASALSLPYLLDEAEESLANPRPPSPSRASGHHVKTWSTALRASQAFACRTSWLTARPFQVPVAVVRSFRPRYFEQSMPGCSPGRPRRPAQY